MSQASVLIASDEPEFAPTIMARWQSERSLPSFLLMTTPAWSESLLASCHMAVIAGVKQVVAPLFKAVEESGKPAILLVSEGMDLQHLRNEYPRMMLVREHEGWVEVLVALATETLRRLEANAHARRAEQAMTQAEGHAMLGRYMLDMRHTLNNALTSVLGNAELMLLEPGAFSADVRDQLATIHTMALRIHDIVQRFSSLESEVKLAAKSVKSHSEIQSSASPLAAAR
ncbi:MAG: histidine kinase dimerization/phospho-acceptor domain-containing protein [Terriglobales bacterium]